MCAAYNQQPSSAPIPHRAGGKYMDPRKLVLLLRQQYGPSNFRVDLRRDQYNIYVEPGNSLSFRLTEEQIDMCRRRY
ncbi:hypothetical protein BDW59DRAFT_149214 [Aspergillus cavernicola]|uniref:Uncharacterized protein n=1 Tax=Aspergillus cavernicola TaxID=176166 RepID=A0ABR4I6A4_9EURO